ncbi:MAG: SDR family NAD(P)-dependent oxidoreductase, partial [Gemmatimonadaceae bacterium]|nr:SDR family NAD(P)-dependent oxidoreductase [Gemmatimonadaceae bacterium]
MSAPTTDSESGAGGSRRLADQTAIVTGANSGIGEAIARAFAGDGAAVVVNYHADSAEADRVVHDIVTAGGRAAAVRGDVSREQEVEALFATAVRQFGTVDILVSNAGLQQDAALTDMTLAQWQKVIDVNLTGGFLCARTAPSSRAS